jgi:hypothetical protein
MTLSINKILQVDYIQHTSKFPHNTIRAYVKANALPEDRIVVDELEKGKNITPNDVIQIINVEPSHPLYQQIIDKFNPQKINFESNENVHFYENVLDENKNA